MTVQLIKFAKNLVLNRMLRMESYGENKIRDDMPEKYKKRRMKARGRIDVIFSQRHSCILQFS